MASATPEPFDSDYSKEAGTGGATEMRLQSTMPMKMTLLCAALVTLLSLPGCANRSEVEVETPAATTTTTKRGTTQVVKDQIPAEGQRKIPVTQEY